jgi:hypothetical protein
MPSSWCSQDSLGLGFFRPTRPEITNMVPATVKTVPKIQYAAVN